MSDKRQSIAVQLWLQRQITPYDRQVWTDVLGQCSPVLRKGLAGHAAFRYMGARQPPWPVLAWFWVCWALCAVRVLYRQLSSALPFEEVRSTLSFSKRKQWVISLTNQPPWLQARFYQYRDCRMAGQAGTRIGELLFHYVKWRHVKRLDKLNYVSRGVND